MHAPCSPRSRLGFVAALVIQVLAPFALAQQQVRAATYNIKFLKATISDQRAANLRRVIKTLDADIIGLQEIDDRAALEKVFDRTKWDLAIDDQSGNNQMWPSRCACRFGPSSTPGPGRRGCRLPVQRLGEQRPVPQSARFPVHRGRGPRGDRLALRDRAPRQARLGANQQSDGDGTDARREDAVRRIISVLEQLFDGKRYVLLGDMNNNPDHAP